MFSRERKIVLMFLVTILEREWGWGVTAAMCYRFFDEEITLATED